MAAHRNTRRNRHGPPLGATRLIRITPAPQPASHCDVVIEAGALARLDHLLSGAAPADRYALISDDVVFEIHGERVVDTLRHAGIALDAFTFPAGEPYKTRDTWAYLGDRMSAAGLGRDCCVVALGGGVVGDVAGFVAATYLRGVPCVQVPTTLLSMLDASIGGKTGVDTDYGKNLIGSFHQPRMVVMDPTVVWTQEPGDMIAGAAEAVKHGAIADADYFAWIEANAHALLACDPDALTSLVRRSVEIKAAVAGRDPFEAGERAILNFGHTIGHALETITHYRMSHGHAVARGMIAEAALGEARGITTAGTVDRLRSALSALGLPVDMPVDIDATAVLDLTRMDKKARRGHPRYVMLDEIGRIARTPADEWTWEILFDDPS